MNHKPASTLLVTGAAGKTGQAVIRALSARAIPVRALVHRPQCKAHVTALGANEVVVGDLRDQKALEHAMGGVHGVYHICPNVHPEEIAIGECVITAARAAGVSHLVYHSVLHPQTEAMPHHWQKLRVEEQLLESGLPVTILQPTVYMQNLLAQKEQLQGKGVYTIPYGIDTRLSMIDLLDIGQVAAHILTDPVHMGATYELVGEPSLTQQEVAAILSQQMGRRITLAVISLDEWRQASLAAGLSPYQVETLCQMFRYYQSHGLTGNSNVLNWLLERPPTSLAAFAARELAS